MGINFIVMVKDHLGRTQEEVNAAFGVRQFKYRTGKEETWPEWFCFTWEGTAYVSWLFTPRYFEPQVGDPQWEALRQYLVRVRHFFGDGDVLLSNDILGSPMPEEGEDFWLPLPLDELLLAPPDLEQYPELAQVQELNGLSW
jgi:hypothetical protein